MACRYAAHFGLEAERAEENWLGTRLHDSGKQRIGAVLMVAVDHHYRRPLTTNRVFGDIRVAEVHRLQTSELHHQTEQRSDYFLARENQHLAQCGQPERNVGTPATYGPG